MTARTPIDHIADRLQFIAAAIPTSFSDTANQAAARLTDMHEAGHTMSVLLGRILEDETVTPDEIEQVLLAWENAL